MAVESHRDLIVWQKAVDLVVNCDRLTDTFPNHENFGLTSQLRRAAVSIPANIAEGKGRRSTGAYLNFLNIASGSLAELDTHLELAVRLGYIPQNQVQTITRQIEEVGRMLSGLTRSLGRPNS